MVMELEVAIGFKSFWAGKFFTMASKRGATGSKEIRCESLEKMTNLQ